MAVAAARLQRAGQHSAASIQAVSLFEALERVEGGYARTACRENLGKHALPLAPSSGTKLSSAVETRARNLYCR